MSRIGRYPVAVPQGVEVKLEGKVLRAKGKLGELKLGLTDDVVVSQEPGKVWIKPANDGKRARVMWGTVRSIVNNMVTGVSKGYVRQLEISGVGFRAAVQGKNLQLQLGFSHDVVVPIPEGIQITVDKNVNVELKSADRAKLGQFCAEIRAMKKPEPYKGKGIKYKEETVRRKEGKKK